MGVEMISNESIASAQCQAKNYIKVKNVLDMIFALVLLVMLSPLMLLVGILIRLDSRGSALYCQTRVGRYGKLFTMFKFRTMHINAPVLSTEDMQKQQAIPFTRIGPFLRKSSLDELPQLFNIILGEMSFIGPRPSLPTQTDVNELREHLNAQHLKPGITGLAQAIGRDDLDNETKVGYDAEYCHGLNLLMDIKILFKTFAAVASARGNK